MPTIVLQPDAIAGIDTEITAAIPAGNIGVRTDFRVGLSATSALYKGLIKFDLSSIPSQATIVSAVLSLYCTLEDDSADRLVEIRRSLVEWFEGNKNGTSPDPGTDGSTWNLRNHNGPVGWTTVIGGSSGNDYSATAEDSTAITGTGSFFDFDVTVSVGGFVAATYPNYGWWLVMPSPVTPSRKTFASSDSATAAQRPKLTITYEFHISGNTSGSSSVSGTLKGKGKLSGSAVGVASNVALLTSNQHVKASAAGTSTATGTLRGSGKMRGSAFGDSTAQGDIKASYHSQGSAHGTSSHVAHLKGIFRMSGLAQGSSQVNATPSFQGQLRGSAHGTSTASAIGYARAKNVAAVIGCNPVPLFYITDGSIKPNGQLNILNFLSDKNGYLLKNYRPAIAQWKGGGEFTSSPQSQGRRLKSRTFDNAIDVLEVAAYSHDQDSLIEFQQELLAFQEAAADYWVSDSFLPYYFVARSARETNTRYAVIHAMSVPELENPYSQPFFDHNGAAFEGLTVRIERGLWLSTPPGRFDCVEISSLREWTVSGWQVGV